MEGLQILHSLPSDKKDKIEKEFGSIEELYKRVFDNYNEDYKLHRKARVSLRAKHEQ